LEVDGPFRFRPATNLDVEAVRPLVWTVLGEHGFVPDPMTTDADLADIEACYLRPGGSFDVLLNQAGEVVGTVGLYPLGEGRCELRKMYLVAAYRGRGLGKRLLHHALNRARQLGFRRVDLETASSLVVAGQLYESFGFRPFVPDHMSPRCDRAYYLDLGDGDRAEPDAAPDPARM
jgi:putative acetyltransferase